VSSVSEGNGFFPVIRMSFSWGYDWTNGENHDKRIKYIKWKEDKAEKKITEYLN
jgi:hypothetical protein